MGFMRSKAQPVKAPKPVAPVTTPIPSAPSEPVTAQAIIDQEEADKVTKKKQQIRQGKSALTVGLKASSGALNTGTSDTKSNTGLSVGGA